METTILIIYLCISAVILVVGVFLAGLMSRDHLDGFDCAMHSLTLAIAWPLILGIAILIAPFYGIFLLGKKFNKTAQ